MVRGGAPCSTCESTNEPHLTSFASVRSKAAAAGVGVREAGVSAEVEDGDVLGASVVVAAAV